VLKSIGPSTVLPGSRRTTRPFAQRRRRWHWDVRFRRCSSGWARRYCGKDLDLIDGICQAPNGTDFGGHLQVVVWSAVVPGWSRRVMPVSRRRQLGVLPRQCPADTDAVVVQMFRRPVRVGRMMHWKTIKNVIYT